MARKAAAARTAPPAAAKSGAATAPPATPARRRVSLAKATEQLRTADPVLAGVIDAVGKLPNARQGRPERDDHYGALVRAIVGQQLSVFAARAIYGRLTERFGGRPPTPQELVAQEPEELRAAAGLSRAKVGFLRSLAEHVLSGELELERLDRLPDDEVIAELVAVKGLGEWTAHMFLMFHLERPDVLAVGDLGIRRAIERAYGLDELPAPAEVERIGEAWRPFRTLACRYLWRSLQNEPG
ncbi:MAG TPA: DNA-3-methyladenine glycosylase [Solirubrobacteraceae bacterium]|nr:DNA-3-methyladenine glycosylase [Solirubrobacteraceae bacterium]